MGTPQIGEAFAPKVLSSDSSGAPTAAAVARRGTLKPGLKERRDGVFRFFHIFFDWGMFPSWFPMLTWKNVGGGVSLSFLFLGYPPTVFTWNLT